MANTFDWEKYEKSPTDSSDKFDWKKHPTVEPKRDAASSPEKEEESFAEEAANFAVEEGLPIAGQIVGGMAGTILDPVLGPAGTLGGAGLGYASAKEISSLINELRGKPVEEQNFGENVLFGAGTELGGMGLAKVIGKVGGYAAKKLPEIAEKMALKATGATPSQAYKFKEGAGKELLEKGYIKAGDTVENIAERLSKVTDETNKLIDSSLKELDAQGAVVNRQNIISKLEGKLQKLKGDESKSEAANQLQNVINDIKKTAGLPSKSSKFIGETIPNAKLNLDIPLSKAEQIKRGFGDVNFQNPSPNQLGRLEAYQTYRQAVEESAQKLNPELANVFKTQKETYGLVAPIKEAAEKAATREQQSGLGLFKSAGKLALERAPATLAVGANLAGKAAAASTPMIAETVGAIVPPLAVMVKEAGKPTIHTGEYQNTKSIMAMSPQEWNNLSTKLEGQLKEKALLLSGEDVPEAKRRAVIFSLLQDPAFRKSIQPEK